MATIGAAALIYSLYLNRRATYAAVAASTAATESNRIAREQQRAWLTFRGWEVAGYGEPGHIQHYIIKIGWRNTGATPAFRVMVLTAPIDNPIFKDGVPNFGGVDDDDRVVVGPNGEFMSPDQGFTPEQIFDAKTTVIIIRCAISYDTAFVDLHDRRTDTTFEVRYIGAASLDGLRQGNFVPANLQVRPLGGKSAMT